MVETSPGTGTEPIPEPIPIPESFPEPVILLTDRHQAALPLPDVVAAAVTGGIRLVVVREKDLPPVERMRLADRLRGLLAPVGGRVLLAGPVPGPHGCHLAAADPWPLLRRGLVGRSCHRMQELTQAAAGGADYATLSPIFPTRSKPGYGPALGLDALAETSSPAPLPVYALGGITMPAQAGRCAEAGAAGVAVMGALMRAADPVALAAGLVTAVINSRCGDQYLRRPVPGVSRPGEVN